LHHPRVGDVASLGEQVSGAMGFIDAGVAPSTR
jgi:hypothetical protein